MGEWLQLEKGAGRGEEGNDLTAGKGWRIKDKNKGNIRGKKT